MNSTELILRKIAQETGMKVALAEGNTQPDVMADDDMFDTFVPGVSSTYGLRAKYRSSAIVVVANPQLAGFTAWVFGSHGTTDYFMDILPRWVMNETYYLATFPSILDLFGPSLGVTIQGAYSLRARRRKSTPTYRYGELEVPQDVTYYKNVSLYPGYLTAVDMTDWQPGKPPLR